MSPLSKTNSLDNNQSRITVMRHLVWNVFRRHTLDCWHFQRANQINSTFGGMFWRFSQTQIDSNWTCDARASPPKAATWRGAPRRRLPAVVIVCVCDNLEDCSPYSISLLLSSSCQKWVVTYFGQLSRVMTSKREVKSGWDLAVLLGSKNGGTDSEKRAIPQQWAYWR